MSHFTTVKTKIKNLTCLITALEELGLEYNVAEAEQMVRVRGYRGNEELAELCITVSEKYDIGLRLTASGEYEMIADWSELEDLIDTESFIDKLTQRYAYHTVMEQIKTQGFTMDQTETEADGTIRIKVSTWQ